MLGPIRAVTTTVSDLKPIEQAYSSHLGYRVVQRGTVSKATAAGWGAPAVAGRNLLVMQPASGEPTYLRFVQQALPAGFKPMTSFGWNATEIVVEDVDELAEKLQGAPFRTLFPPRDLGVNTDIRAMQVIGPASEVLYLTQIKRHTPGRDLPTAKSTVDRCFIAVAGGPDIEALCSFYRDNFGNQPGPVVETAMRVLSDANGLPLDTKHALCTVPLGGGSQVELDRYPPSTKARSHPSGGLPPGMAIVTFEHPKFGDLKTPAQAPPHPAELPPFRDHRTVTIAGAAGELIELVEI